MYRSAQFGFQQVLTLPMRNRNGNEIYRNTIRRNIRAYFAYEESKPIISLVRAIVCKRVLTLPMRNRNFKRSAMRISD